MSTFPFVFSSTRGWLDCMYVGMLGHSTLAVMRVTEQRVFTLQAVEMRVSRPLKAPLGMLGKRASIWPAHLPCPHCLIQENASCESWPVHTITFTVKYSHSFLLVPLPWIGNAVQQFPSQHAHTNMHQCYTTNCFCFFWIPPKPFSTGARTQIFIIVCSE